jgi:hypothetical protein
VGVFERGKGVQLVIRSFEAVQLLLISHAKRAAGRKALSGFPAVPEPVAYGLSVITLYHPASESVWHWSGQAAMQTVATLR